MAGRPYLNLDVDYLIKEHSAGRTIIDLAAELGVKDETVANYIRRAGGKIFRSTTRIDESAVISFYQSGNSENATAKRFGVSRNVVRRILTAHSIPIRSRSAAESLKWSRMTPSERAKQVSAAHAASKGREVTIRERKLRAKVREERMTHQGAGELFVYAALVDAGYSPIRQKAVGIYNCDMTVDSVAVEVWGGGYHFFGEHAARNEERTRYLFDRGFHVIAITTLNRIPITQETTDCVVRFIEAARRDPAMVRQYRVIRGAGELLAASCADSHQIPLEPTFGRRFDF